MKKILFTLLLSAVSFLLLLPAGADEVKVTLRPAAPAVGDRVSVVISCSSADTGSAEVILPPLGDLARWDRNMRSVRTMMSIRNGVREVTTEYIRQFTALKAGKLVIPPIRLRRNSRETAAPELTVEIAASRKAAAADPEQLQPYGEFTTLPDRPFRPGEKVELHMNVFVPGNFNVLGFNDFRIENFPGAVLLSNPRNREQLQLLSPFRTTVNSRAYVVYPFRGVARVTASGKFYPQASFVLSVREPRQIDNGGFDDDIFDSFFGSRVSFSRPRQLNVVFKDSAGVEVVPPPPVPAGFQDPGVSGKWQVSARLSSPGCRSGEIVELEITLIPQDKGESINDPMLDVPEFKFDGFRIYPPEVVRKDGRISLRYALIPLSPGEKKLDIKLALFEPVSGKYQTFVFSPVLAVTPGSVNVKTPAPAPVVPETAAPAAPPAPETVSTPSDDGLRYLKVMSAGTVKVPLFGNQKYSIIALIAGGFLLVLGDMLYRRFGRNLNAANRRRRREIKQHLRALAAEIRSSADPAGCFRSHGLADLAEMLDLPPGATAQDIADSLDDPELKQFFSELASAGFAPGETASAATVEMREKLFRFLRKLSVVLILFAGSVLIAVPEPDKGSSAYAAGKYTLASEEFRRAVDRSELSVPVLYNLGCAEYRLGNYPEALLWFTRAQLLSPGDPECRANVMLTREQLQLPPEEENSFTARLVAFRDTLFRPDQYLLCAAWGFFLLCVLFVLRGYRARMLRWCAAAVVLFLTVLALLAALEQCDSTYSSERLLVTGKSVELRSLPAENSGSVITVVNGGTQLHLLEDRNSWLRVTAGKDVGWIKTGQARRIFPYGIL
ncbi:MAG: BatD family protein [Lentisphaeria bacterium]|nr:BatD family protein [Lentisphaeria bacterium]